ncbi:MAG: ATP synthase F0 subunit B [Oscillospiraceae bacterium]|jgi:F-type H+-transporting ATPase subunit b|nr:ATP synthase F0 subunit B [Oscillospiraceae bacterium]
MNLFDFNVRECIFVALNLAVLIFALNKLLWKPVNKILSERQTRLSAAQADAEEARELSRRLEQGRAEYNEKFEQRMLDDIKDARTRAGHEYDRIVTEAEDKAQMILNAAQMQAQREREATLLAARSEIVTAAEDLATALLGENLDKDKNTRLVERFLNRGEVGAA